MTNTDEITVAVNAALPSGITARNTMKTQFIFELEGSATKADKAKARAKAIKQLKSCGINAYSVKCRWGRVLLGCDSGVAL